MPRGLPDYGQFTEQYAIAGMADLGEAVARLDSINVFDRRGYTTWQDNFEAPALRWFRQRANTGLLPHHDITRSVSGIQCVHLDVPAGIGSISAISRRFTLIRQGKIGIELWVQGFTKATGYLEAAISVYDGNIPTDAAFWFDTDARTVSIRTPAGTPVIATDVYMTTSELYFLAIKLVVDSDTNMYTRLIVGDTEYDISTHGQILNPASTNRYIRVGIVVVGSAADDMWMYLDNFILTQNEP